ncbi:amino acid adenylation domain-containing protein, partial [Pedobacter suwonensis]
DYGVDRTVLSLFAEQVLRDPSALAIVFEDQVLSYRELDGLSNQMALFLINNDVTSGTVIGLMIDRSPELIVGILGILKAGGTYLPIDSALPEERVLYMLDDSGAEFLLTSSTYLEKYLNHISVLNIAEVKSDNRTSEIGLMTAEVNDLLYIIYTSGSTGKPKGVMVSNGSLVNFIQSQKNLFKIDSSDRILQFSTISFDASVEQIWLALLSGAGLVLVAKDVITDQKMFNDYLRVHKVTHLHTTPSFLESISLSEANSLKRIITGGEVCKPELVNRYVKKYDFYNKYGPTEATISCTIFHVDDTIGYGSMVPIGRPIAGSRVYVVDGYGGLSPMGVAGELCVSGLGLAQGYVGNEKLTAEKFVVNPFEENSLMYRTGDLVRWGPGGNLEFLGRVDDQVKIRGYRIEPGEIEVVMGGLEGVGQVLVVARGDGGEKALVAYYTTQSGEAIPDLKERAQELLPDYMLPSYYVHLSSFLLTVNGKID